MPPVPHRWHSQHKDPAMPASRDGPACGRPPGRGPPGPARQRHGPGHNGGHSRGGSTRATIDHDHIRNANRTGDADPQVKLLGSPAGIPLGCCGISASPLSAAPQGLARIADIQTWSLGYIDLDGNCGPDSWGGELADTAAEVYLYFPTTGGWQIEELLATIN